MEAPSGGDVVVTSRGRRRVVLLCAVAVAISLLLVLVQAKKQPPTGSPATDDGGAQRSRRRRGVSLFEETRDVRRRRKLGGSPPENRTLVVLAASPRVGSTMLSYGLSANPKLVMHGEILMYGESAFKKCENVNTTHAQLGQFSWQFKQCPPPELLKARHPTEQGALDYFKWVADHSGAAMGFKLMPGHVPGVGTSLIYSRVVKQEPQRLVDLVASVKPTKVLFISLRRLCLIDEFLSMDHARKSHQFSASSHGQEKENLDLEAIETFRTALSIYHKTLKEAKKMLAKQHPSIVVHTADLFYESDLNKNFNRTLHMLYEMIGVPLQPDQMHNFAAHASSSPGDSLPQNLVEPPPHPPLDAILSNWQKIPQKFKVNCAR